MRRSRVHLYIFFLTFSGIHFLSAQGTAIVTGTVADEHDIPIPYASVALYNAADSSMQTGEATNNEGKFALKAKPGEYFLKINFLSYEEQLIPDIQLTSSGINLGTITMQPSSVTLEEVEVSAERSEMQLQLDKRVFNVNKDPANVGANAIEILDKLPSISTDIDGNVSLRGSQNVRILIDGKPSGLATPNALRGLQGNMIESIEVITNPSARYDAEGEVGIINIVLKKEKHPGFNGSFEVFTGIPHNHGVGVNANFRRDKVNLFTNYSLNYRDRPGEGYSIERFIYPDTTFYYERFRDHNRQETSNNFQLGLDYFLNEFNTLTMSGIYSFSKGTNESDVIYQDHNSLGELTQTVARYDEEIEIENEIELTLDYRKTFPQKDRELKASFHYSSDEDSEASDITESSTDGSPTIFQRSDNTEDQANGLLQIDYIHPFGNEGKFEAGMKGTVRDIENKYLVEELNDEGVWVIDPEFNDEFLFSENIYAAYIIAGQKAGNFSYQGGLRMEYSDVSTELLVTGEGNNRQYADLFPSVHLAYELAGNNTLQMSYSRRLSRPRFWYLLPFRSFSDNRNFRIGNPDLDPEYTHSMEVGHLKYFESGSLLSSIYYRHRTGVIEHIRIADSTGQVLSYPVNLSTENSYGIEFSAGFNITDDWNVNGNFNFYRSITEGSYEGESLESDSYTWNTRASSKVTFFKKLDFQTSFYYRAPRNSTQGRRLSSYSIDAGLSIDFLKKKGTITLSVRDLFNSRKWRSIIDTPEYYSESEFQWRSRQVQLNFSYRINQKKKRGERSGDEGFDGGDGEF